MSRNARPRQAGPIPTSIEGVGCPLCRAWLPFTTLSHSYRRKRETIAAHAAIAHPDAKSWRKDALPRPSQAAISRLRKAMQ